MCPQLRLLANRCGGTPTISVCSQSVCLDVVGGVGGLPTSRMCRQSPRWLHGDPLKMLGVWSGRLGHACTIAPLTSCPGCVPGMWRDALPTHRLPTIGPNINPPTHTAPHSIPPYFCKSVPHIKTLQQKQKSKNDTKQNTRHIGPDHNPDHY